MFKRTTPMLVAILMTVSVAAPTVALARKSAGQGGGQIFLTYTFPVDPPNTTTAPPAPPAK
jgi:hypothetical protein